MPLNPIPDGAMMNLQQVEFEFRSPNTASPPRDCMAVHISKIRWGRVGVMGGGSVGREKRHVSVPDSTERGMHYDKVGVTFFKNLTNVHFLVNTASKPG